MQPYPAISAIRRPSASLPPKQERRASPHRGKAS